MSGRIVPVEAPSYPALESPAGPASAGARRDVLIVGVVVFAALVIRVYEVAAHALPFGFAGLYTLMAETIVKQHYGLPSHIALYGPGGVPFAYPPLSLYAMAIAHGVFGIPWFTYLRFAPLLFTALYAVPLYLLYRDLTSRAVAGVALALAMTSPDILVYHEFADGIVRGFAFLFTCAGLWLALRGLRGGRPLDIALAAVFFAMVIASHLANAVFFAVSLAVFALTTRPSIRTARIAAVIGAGGIVLSAPWWALILYRFGPSVFIHALQSRTSSAPGSAHGLGIVLDVLGKYLPVAQLWYPEYALGLAGAVYCIRRREWTLPLWIGATVLIVPDWQRFVGTVVAVLAAQAAVAGWRATTNRPPLRIAFAFPVGLAAALILAGYAFWAVAVPPILSGSDMRAVSWMRTNTSVHAPFMVLTTNRELAEWFPYLLRRPPVIAEWGSEWTGGVVRQHALFDEQAICVRHQSLACLQQMMDRERLRPRYLILEHRGSYGALATAFGHSSSWRLAYANAGDSVWARREGTAAGGMGSINWK